MRSWVRPSDTEGRVVGAQLRSGTSSSYCNPTGQTDRLPTGVG